MLECSWHQVQWRDPFPSVTFHYSIHQSISCQSLLNFRLAHFHVDIQRVPAVYNIHPLLSIYFLSCKHSYTFMKRRLARLQSQLVHSVYVNRELGVATEFWRCIHMYVWQSVYMFLSSRLVMIISRSLLTGSMPPTLLVKSAGDLYGQIYNDLKHVWFEVAHKANI